MIADVMAKNGVERQSTERRTARGRVKSQARRAELVGIAKRVFAEKGYASATVRDVGDEAGILSGSLYYHFTSKDALLKEILLEALDHLTKSYQEAIERASTPLEALESLLGAGFRWTMADGHSARILQNDFPYLRTAEGFEFVNAKNNEIKTAWLAALGDAQASGALRADLDIGLAYRMLMGTVLSTVRWFDPDGPESADEIADRLTDLVLGGLTRSSS
jgi:AcrR family transcriptional regulator